MDYWEAKTFTGTHRTLHGGLIPWGFSELVGLVEEVHGLLDPTAQKFKTTALGMTDDGKLFIASSDKIVPKVQREWAQKKGNSVVNGPGHAEETII
ncbi:hypothetical protein V2K00_10245 [Pseudomonas alliivorans]|nr:hypothetical protein [Pseudomonas alliivorans]MEE5094703.1 hypothetical protein [Pseudomonas alliivorans]